MLPQRVRVKTSLRKKMLEDEELVLKVILERMAEGGDTELKWYLNELDCYYQYHYQREGIAENYLKPVKDGKKALEKEYSVSKDADKKQILKQKIEERDFLLKRVEYLLRDAKREMKGMRCIYLVYESEAAELKVLKDIYSFKKKKIDALKDLKLPKK